MSEDPGEEVASDEATDDDSGPLPRPLGIACAIVVLEALALVSAAGLLIADTAEGAAGSVGRALFGAALALVGAAVLALCVRGLLRRSPASRTPVVILQLLAIPVSYSLAFQAGRVGYGGPIFVAALAVLYLLFTPPVRAVLDRDITK